MLNYSNFMGMFDNDETFERKTIKTQEIQRAIDNTPTGGTLKISPGVYEMSKNPEHKSVSEYGESYYALKISKPITILMDGAIFNVASDEKYGVFWVDRTSNVHLKGGVFKGEKIPENGSLISSVAVFVQDSWGNTFENMTMSNFSQGIHLYHSNRNLLRNLSTENNLGSGIISFSSEGNTIDSCKVHNSGDGHLSLYNGRNNHVMNSVVTEDRKDRTGEQGIAVESERQSKIETTLVSGFYYGIDIKNGSEENIIDYNTTFNNRYNIDIRPGDGGINLMTPSHRIQITNNLATNPREDSTYGIYVGIGEGHIIRGNTLNPDHLIIDDKKMLDQYIDQNFYVE